MDNSPTPVASGSDVTSTDLAPSKRAAPSKDRSLKCKTCGKKFSHYNDRKKHELIHLPGFPYSCDECSYRGKTPHYLGRHKKKVHGERTLRCEHCPAMFVYQCKLEEHMRVHTGEKPYKCEHCPKTFRVPYTLKIHMLTHTDEKPYKCSFCEYACRDTSTLRKHQNKHMGLVKMFDCSACNKSFDHKYKLKAHVAEVHLALAVRRVACDLCGHLFRTKSQVSMHKKQVHSRAYATRCCVCGVRVRSRYNLRAHLASHLPHRPYGCTQPGCGKAFKDRGTLKKHTMIHKPELHFPCDLCQMKFSRRHRLNKHMKTHEDRKKSVVCDYCQVSFYTKNYLIKHIKEKHTDRPRYICSECGITTNNKPGMILHWKFGHDTHLDDKECKICHSKFKRYEYLKNHYYRTHNVRYKMVKPFAKKPPKQVRDLQAEVKVKMEPVDEEFDQIDLLNVEKEELQEDGIEYSRRVLKEDLSQAVFHGKRNMNEADFDRFLVTHVFKKSKTENDDIPVDVNPIEFQKSKETLDELVKKCRKDDRKEREKREKVKALARRKARDDKREAQVSEQKKKEEQKKTEEKQKERRDEAYLARRQEEELAEFEKLRLKYNERMKKVPLHEIKKKECTKIKYFKAKTNEHNDISAESEDDISFAVKPSLNSKDCADDEISNENNDDDNNGFSDHNDENGESNENPKKRNDVNNDDDDNDDDEVNFAVKSKRNSKECANDELTSASNDKERTNESNEHENKEFSKRNDESDENPKESNNINGGDDNDEVSFVVKPSQNKYTDVGEIINKTIENNHNKNDFDDEFDENSESSKSNDKLTIENGVRENEKNEAINNDLAAANSHISEKMEDCKVNSKNKCKPNEIDYKDRNELKEDIEGSDDEIKSENDIFFGCKTKKVENFDNKTNLNEEFVENSKVETADDKKNELLETDDKTGDNREVRRSNRKRKPNKLYEQDDNTAKHSKMSFKTHQCYVCFKLYPTKEELIQHCQTHFDVCSLKTLTKCPICDFVTPKSLSQHLLKKHDVHLKIPYNHIKERDLSDGSKYCYNANGTTIEVIPSVKILNKNAYIELDKKNREKKDKIITKTKLVRKGKEWIVEKEKIDLKFDLLPEFGEDEYKKLKVSDNYLDRMKQIYKLAKKRGLKMAFPCFDCEKICQNLSALKLHNRRHQIDPKPFRPRGEVKKEKEIHQNRKVKTNLKNRNAKPKPIKHKHKCDDELKKFYETNIRGGDIEFWQFLKIFNKIDRENITEFDELEERSDFGLHFKENPKNVSETNTKNKIESSKNNNKPKNDLKTIKTVINTTNSTATVKTSIQNTKTDLTATIDTAVGAKNFKSPKHLNKKDKPYKRVVMISKGDYRKRNEAKNRLREKYIISQTMK